MSTKKVKIDARAENQTKIDEIQNNICDLIDDGFGINEILEGFLKTLPKTHLDKLEENVKELTPEIEYEVLIQINVEAKKDASTDIIADALAQNFEDSPLSVKDWFRVNINDFNSMYCF